MAIPNGLNPEVDSVKVANRYYFGSGSAFIASGTATGTTAITAAVGAAINGAIYFSQNGNGEVWIGTSGAWTQLTIN